LRSDGTDASLSAIQVADVPTLNQNTTGTADNVTGVVAVANGGTGSATQNFVDLTTDQTIAGIKTFSSPIAGSVTGNATNVTGVVAVANGGTGSATQNFVDLTTDQTVAGIKTFSSPIAGSVTGNATNVTGVVAVANGGTGSATQNFVDLTTDQTVAGIKTFSSPIAGSVTGNATNVTGVVAVANGGTGSATQNFVDLTTDQTVAGIKTFSSPIAGSVTGNAATVTTNANLTGDVTSVGNATTLSNTAVISQVLTGYSAAAGTVAATDNILQAIQKVDGNVAAANTILSGKQNTLTNSAGLAGALDDETGTGLAVFATSPTLVTPNLGTPSAVVLTNATGTASALNIGGNAATATLASTVTTNADLTGEVTSTGNATTLTNAAVIGKVLTGYSAAAGSIAATDNILQAIQKVDGNVSGKQDLLINSAGLAGALADETGTGLAVFATSPVLERPRVDLLIGNSTLPQTAAIAGTNVTSVTITGTNLAGTIEISHNGNGSGNEDLVTVTYVGAPFSGDSYPILYPANPTTAALTGDRQVFAEGTVSGFKIKTGIDKPSTTVKTYKWNYHVISN
jgi:hypothetical protein